MLSSYRLFIRYGFCRKRAPPLSFAELFCLHGQYANSKRLVSYITTLLSCQEQWSINKTDEATTQSKSGTYRGPFNLDTQGHISL